MDNNKYANATLDDIVFEGRNRAYGAYTLRKIYTKHLVRGLILAIAIFSFLLASPVILKAIFPEEDVVLEEKVVDVNTLENPPPLDETTPPPPPPPPPPVEPPVAATIKFTPPIIKKDEQVKKQDVPDQEEMKDVEISTKTQEGVKDAPPDLSDLEGTAETAGAVEEIFQFVEQKPEFPGGEGAMMKYLADHIRYPSVAQRNGLEGLVVLSFVVNRQGEISDIQVLKKLGGGTDEEAVRVVKSMPKWKPGRNNGREVSVRYNLPVRFTIK